jgi:hypothetical protein
MSNKKWYQRSVPIGTQIISTRTYRCPNHPNVVLFRVPAGIPEPKDTVTVKCPEGKEDVTVPNYSESQKISLS